MPTSSLHVSYRPVRVGFLVRPDVMDDFIRAVEWASAIWGGIFSPILPLLSDDAALDALIARDGPQWRWRTEFAPGEDTLIVRHFNITPDGNEAIAVEFIYARV